MVSLNYTIFEMVVTDIPELIKIWDMTPNICYSQEHDYDQVVARYLERNSGMSFIARDNASGKIIGTILAGTDGMYGTIRHAVVLPSFQGQGIMMSLTEAVMSKFKDFNIHEAFLYVLDGNISGNSYYEKRGWQKVQGVNTYKIQL